MLPAGARTGRNSDIVTKRYGKMKKGRSTLIAASFIARAGRGIYRKTLALTGVLCFFALALTACTGGGGSGSALPADRTVIVSGSVGSGYGIPPGAAGAPSVLFSGETRTSVDRIVAIPLFRGSLKAESMASRKESVINSDSTFSLDLDKDKDWLLALIDTTAPDNDRFVGSLAVSTGATGSLLFMPLTSASVNMIDLGTVARAPSSADGIADADISVAFTMTGEALSTLARTDGLFRNAKNIVNNYDAGTGIWYQLRPDFSWCGDYFTLLSSTDPAAYTFLGLNFQMDTNSPSVTMDQICTAGSMTLELVPPQPVSSETVTYGPSSPLTNSGTCGSYVVSGMTHTQTTSGDFSATDAYGNISYSTIPRFDSVPAGNWLWNENGVTRAVYDMAGAHLPLAADGRPMGFVPSFKVNFNNMDERRITSIDVKWKYYDPVQNGYVELTDLSVLAHAIGSAEVKFGAVYNDQRETEEIYFDPVVTTSIVPSGEWYVMNKARPDRSPSITGFYESGGFGHFFHFFDPLSAGLTACGRVFHPVQEIGRPFADFSHVAGIRAFGIPNWSDTEPHNGIDLVVTRATATVSRIIAPVSGTIISVSTGTNEYSNPPGNVLVSVKVYVNDVWSVDMTLEPSAAGPEIEDQQFNAIRVVSGQEVSAGDDIGDLIVASDHEAHLHLTVRKNETPVCAYAYGSADFKAAVDLVAANGTYNSLPNGNVCY